MGRTRFINGGGSPCVIAPALAQAPRQDCAWARPVPACLALSHGAAAHTGPAHWRGLASQRT
eukprot:scaffold59617_cov79-Phaeocystis_antarctica.AAC.19